MPSIQELNKRRLHPMVHDCPAKFLTCVQPYLEHHELRANLIFHEALARSTALPEMEERLHSKGQLLKQLDMGPAYNCNEGEVSMGTMVDPPSQFWITLWTSSGRPDSSGRTHMLDIVLSCLRTPLGDQPIFLFFNGPPEHLQNDFVTPRVHLLSAQLQAIISSRRLFSCFGPTALVDAFAIVWANISGHTMYSEPFYHAFQTFCNQQTFQDRFEELPRGHQMRIANMEHLHQAAVLCQAFAADSIYFLRDGQQALEEAQYYIKREQLWVYVADHKVTTIVALTRATPRVIAISKVYTLLEERKKGYAESLVRLVCRVALKTFDQVVLYVGHGNGAEFVYGNVGFVGVGKRKHYPGEVRLLEDWKEVGFKDTDRGYW